MPHPSEPKLAIPTTKRLGLRVRGSERRSGTGQPIYAGVSCATPRGVTNGGGRPTRRQSDANEGGDDDEEAWRSRRAAGHLDLICLVQGGLGTNNERSQRKAIGSSVAVAR